MVALEQRQLLLLELEQQQEEEESASLAVETATLLRSWAMTRRLAVVRVCVPACRHNDDNDK